MTRPFARIHAIYRKELLEILRDRRTLIAMVVIPVVLYPVLMLGFLAPPRPSRSSSRPRDSRSKCPTNPRPKTFATSSNRPIPKRPIPNRPKNVPPGMYRSIPRRRRSATPSSFA